MLPVTCLMPDGEIQPLELQVDNEGESEKSRCSWRSDRSSVPGMR
nr:hypothetical protein [Petrachloros mirabilis]